MGRIFFGTCIIGIGVLHFFFPGIRPIILPNATHIPPQLSWIVYFTALVLIGAGLWIVSGKKLNTISLIMGVSFLLLFLFGHLPAFLSVQGLDKLKYWTNLNKVLALSGGSLLLASGNLSKSGNTRFDRFANRVSPLGRYFFAFMLLMFGIGHLLSTGAISNLVPDYIPLKKLWTFLGGIVLVGSAISFFIKFQVKKIALLLAIILFIWLVTLHLYYTVHFPNWQEGENFIGSLTCLAFCGTALIISQTASKK